jgi:hypothetical protein
MRVQKVATIVLIILVIVTVSVFHAYEFGKMHVNTGTAPTENKTALKSSSVKVNNKSNGNSGKVKRERRFNIEIVDVRESGALSRVITAKLINNDGYAKNVKVTLELFVDNDRIGVNGKDALTIAVGDMNPKSSVEREVEISVSFFDGLKIKSRGYVDVKLTISWDGGREVIKKRIRV